MVTCHYCPRCKETVVSMPGEPCETCYEEGRLEDRGGIRTPEGELVEPEDQTWFNPDERNRMPAGRARTGPPKQEEKWTETFPDA